MKKIFSLIFLFLLIVPGMAWLIGLDFGINVDNKKLDLPRPHVWAFLDNEYYRSFDQYLNYTFSLRSALTFAKNWLDYHIFRTTDSTTVHIGKNGWLYTGKSIDDFKKEACEEKMEVGRMLLELHALEAIIEASGRQFLFFVAPNKSSIYPEHVGFVPKATECNHSRYGLLLESIKKHPLRSFVRLDEKFRTAKEHGPLLYEKTSTYWNRRGALVAAQKIHQQIFDSPMKEPSEDHHSSGMIGKGDLYRDLMGSSPQDEDKSFQNFANPDQSDLSTGLLWGDIFTHNFLFYARNMFRQLDIILTDRVPSRQHGENLRAYDFIVLERAESKLATVHVDLEKIFSLFEHEAQIPERYLLDLRSALPVSHISLDFEKGGLQIKSMGAQSAFDLISVPGSDAISFRVLKLSIDASQSNTITVTSLTDTPYVMPKYLKHGTTEIYLPLPFQKTLSLRIQPGKRAGLFTLHSAEVLGFMKNPSVPELLPDNITISKIDQANNVDLLQEGSIPDISKLEHNTDITAAISDGATSDSTFKMFMPDDFIFEGAEVSNSRQHFFDLTDEDTKHIVIASDSNEGVSATKPEIDDSNTVADVSAVDIGSKDVTVSRADVPTSETSSITIADFDDGKIFQRTGISATITVSGIYAGMPKAIEARVVRDSTLEEIVPWTVIDPFPQKGIFLGMLSDVSQGGWYNIQVRYSNNHSVVSYGTHKWGVGILVACLGQSNMKEWFYKGTALRAHPLLRKFTLKGWAKLDRSGNGAIAFGNRIIERLDIPVGLLDYSKNGSGLTNEADWGTGYWEDMSPNSIYNCFVDGVSEVGGAIEFVVWIQGEADAARGIVTEDEYTQSLENFITNQIRSDIHNGSDRECLPFLIVTMVKRPGGRDKAHQAIRNAQKHVAENVTDCYLAATILDLKNQGREHLTPESFIIMGRRVAQTVLFILGKEKYYRGPCVANVKRLDNHTIEVKIRHRGGSDFTPDSGISGWEILVNGIPVHILEVYRHDPQTIRIVLENPLTGKAKIRYLYGAAPDVSKPVLDNSGMAFPLEEFQSEIRQK
ncbi:MAG: hypothetical protein JRI30_02895 [Deltaproteobacteria bacterium]|nr:hypothetical protein [Deltaproteobacteria bacterium]